MKFAPESFPKIQKFWGLLEYKPQWTLSIKGWIILFALILISGLTFIRTIQPFLAMNAPVKADTLVLEGWVGDIVVQAALEEFKQGNYQRIITTGTNLLQGSFLSQYQNYAQMTASTLIALGIPENKIVPIVTPNVIRNRTAASAETVRDWISQSNVKIQAMNIYSYDVHTRRSWYLFKKVLPPDIKIGAIAYPGEYNPQIWWTSSAGVKSVLSEAISYLYTRIFWKI
ncbi:ElyC/SanA/YdcF family protein [Gloeothece verrucosa]|uniref:DUF218 domain-containing protein n=1 Tax=Gloeothece verrucosa (strain PCC 7822) TaxID=497965 RepID=E0U8X2_GLOV7|nr:ElyC/SanA/YdcF family protein [Gloeothece verrucosa]ADN16111.1 conserved hypothetical protein [Gloeothece verrucosa PCC 7822]